MQEAKGHGVEGGWEVSGSDHVLKKSDSSGEEREGRSWRRMLGERGFLKMEDTGYAYMLKEIVGDTRGRRST